MDRYNELLKEKQNARYFCHTASDEKTGQSFFLIEDVERPLTRRDMLCNSKLYHHTLRECVDHLRGTVSEIRYHGVNINPMQPDIFLSMNRNTGEVYRTYHEDYSYLELFEPA